MSKKASNNYIIEASITWIRPEIIQKKFESHTDIYYLNIKFLENAILWSVKVYVNSVRKEFNFFENTYIAQIGFLFEDEILDFLKEGMDFWLLEGPVNLVGNGTIIRIKRNVS